MRRFYRLLLHRLYRPLLLRYLSRPRHYRYGSLQLVVQPGVFHPGFFGSSRVFASFLSSLPLKQTQVLDLGCGSGLIGLQAARLGAEVTSLDIHPEAVLNTRQNAARNQLPLRVLQSDLFSGLEPQPFDFILINPPYFPKTPRQEAEYAWYCGEDFGYFRRLFQQLPLFLHQRSAVYLILSEVCDLNAIQIIAEKAGKRLRLIRRAPRWWETFLIYQMEVSDEAGLAISQRF